MLSSVLHCDQGQLHLIPILLTENRNSEKWKLRFSRCGAGKRWSWTQTQSPQGFPLNLHPASQVSPARAGLVPSRKPWATVRGQTHWPGQQQSRVFSDSHPCGKVLGFVHSLQSPSMAVKGPEAGPGVGRPRWLTLLLPYLPPSWYHQPSLVAVGEAALYSDRALLSPEKLLRLKASPASSSWRKSGWAHAWLWRALSPDQRGLRGS